MTRNLKLIKVTQGFSLVEMAIVLIILGFVLGALLMPLQVQRQQLFQSQTENTLEVAKKALLGYAQSQGRLPCPATASSNTDAGSKGLEAPIPITGTCTVAAGFLPAATLGIQPTDSNGFALDAWNNRIRYAITQVGVGGSATPDFTTVNDMNTVGITTLAPDLNVICGTITTTECTAGTNLTNNAVAVIFSTGKNFGQSIGVDETSNLIATTKLFYSRSPTAATAAPSNEFDDMVIWISPYVLYNAMIEAGQLH
ncbi:MAG: type II secretion system protein [Methylotenera sp.]|uniref:type II secretion system protein n=1 Tax=Methylotenera sp. TaxID=2051956 RepID=UPI002488484E|nr:type II secretion system protein [Methylotenera sp.]MDI1308204.1 type II secretion system protein [Methylotenera sp.]